MAPQAAATDPYASIATPIAAGGASSSDASDPYASIATPLPSAPSTGSRVGQFVADAATGVGEGASWAVHKLADAGTAIGTGQIPGVSPSATIAAAKGIWDQLPPVELTHQLQQTLPVINAFHKARESGASVSDAIKAADDATRQHISNLAPVQQVVDDFKANPTRETAKQLTKAAAVAASMFAGGEALAPEAEAVEVAAPAAETAVASKPFFSNPFRRLLQKATQTPEAAGEAAAQPIAQAGVKAVAPTVGPSLRSGIDFQAPFTEAKTLYRTVDEAAKTNFQDLYAKLDAAQDDARLAASGSPEEAKAQLNVKNTQDAIDDAKKMAANSGVPNVDKTLAQADAKYTEAQANKDLNSKFFGNQSVISGNVAHGATENINVDSAIKTLENMDKPNKYGVSRLQQTTLGKDGAFKLKQVFYDAKKAGKTAMDSRALRNIVLKWGIPGVTTALGVGYEMAK